MKKYLPLFLFSLLLHCTALAQQNSRSNNESSNLYRGAYQRMATGSSASHTLEIRNGTLWAWGQNNYGQLGDGTTVNKNTPTQVGTDTKWVTVAGGSLHTIALKSDGTLWAWGANFYSQLGDGTNVSKSLPVQIGTDTKWVSVSGGSGHTVALKSDGTLWAWGDNTFGQLGNGNTLMSVPTQIGTDTKWVSVSAGSEHTLALKSDGTLWAWGANQRQQLGDGTNVSKNLPVQIGTDTKWMSVSGGLDHTIALKSDGTLWAWGYNSNGQLGNGTSGFNGQNTPIQIGTDTKWVSVSVGGNHTTALKSDGTLWAWGYNNYGQLGNGNAGFLANETIPTQVGTDTKWVSVFGGSNHTIALKSDGTLWTWGYNSIGQLGDGTTVNKNAPLKIRESSRNWISVTGGESYTLAIKSDGTLWAWGRNDYGQLGDGTTVDKSTPVQVGTDTKWVSISGGGRHTLAIKSDGTLWAWGANFSGQLGDGTTVNKNIPTQVGTDTKWVSVDGGIYNTIAWKSDGTLWTWGDNIFGQLGDGTNTNKNIPTQIGNDTKWVSVAMGLANTLALKSNGTLWAWGDNADGAIGDGTNTDKNVPVQVGTDTKWVSISGGGRHTLAIKSDGTLWSWGYNFSGQLGDGTNTDKNIPTQIGTDTKWVSVSGGYNHTIALKSDGTLWAWGKNNLGQLGDGTTTNKSTPTQISSQTGVVSLGRIGGSSHSSILKDTRSTICLNGDNSNGQLGDGTTVGKSSFNCNNSVCAVYSLSTAATTTYNNRPIAGIGNRTDFQLDCAIAASLIPAGAAAVTGTATAKVFVDATVQTTVSGTAYVQRHYDIEPATNANAATATVMLYFTQAEFTAFNAARGTLPALPINAADSANNKANLRVTQFHGVPTGGNAPANYPATWSGVGPAHVLITPTSVVWEEENQWWTVAFPVMGFSGFFVSTTQSAPLPVKLLSFTAKAQGTANLLNWSTATEGEGISFEVTRSANGSNFEKLALVRSGKVPYTFYDEQPLDGVNYYRLNILEPSGDQTVSNIAIVRHSGSLDGGGISVWPVPASNTIYISNSNASLAGSTVAVFDVQGRVVSSLVLNANTQIDVQNWPAGIYILRFEDGTRVKVVKQ